MTNPDPEYLAKMRERIRRLLALAGNNPNEHESASAAAKAAELMAEYNITASETQTAESITSTVKHDTVEFGQYYFGIEAIGSAVCKAFYCTLLLARPSVEGRWGKLHFIGREMNRMAAAETFNWLSNLATIAEANEWERWQSVRNIKKRPNTDPAKMAVAHLTVPTREGHRKNFLLGFGDSLRQKLTEWRIEQAKAANIQALTLDTGKENQEYIKDNWGRTTAAHGIRANNSVLYGRGHAVGSAVDLNRSERVRAAKPMLNSGG